MQAGKAIYYILANDDNVSNVVSTRIYPEVVAQDAVTPFIFFQVTGVTPDSYKDGGAQIDEVRVEVSGVSTSYDEVCDLSDKIRGALDRISGTFNEVSVESVEFNDVTIDTLDKPRRYVVTLDFTARIIRGAFQLATGSPITGYLLTQLNDVNATEPLDREALVYDEASESWINGGVAKLTIPVKNLAPTSVPLGTIVKATTTQGDRIVISAYSAGDDPKLLVGVASENIGAGADGHVLTYGEVRGIDTSSYTLGTILYPGSSGAWSTTPDANNIALGIVTRVQENTGRIFVRSWVPGQAEAGSNNLDDLGDVTITSPSDGQVLEYDGVARAWLNVPPQVPTPPPSTTDELTEGTTNLYFTDARVEANSAVSANTAKRSYPLADETKLAGIAAGAEVNVQSDWSAATGDAAILNKPSIPTSLDELGGNADDIAEGQTNLFFTSAERTKLSGIETGAEANVQPLVGVAYKDPAASTQLITGTATTISFDGEYYDTENIIDTSANTISLSANSIYLVTADVVVYQPTTTSGSRSEIEVRMLVNGSAPAGFLRRIYARDAAGGQGGSASFSFPYNVGGSSPVISWDVKRVGGATTQTRLYHCQFSYIKLWG